MKDFIDHILSLVYKYKIQLCSAALYKLKNVSNIDELLDIFHLYIFTYYINYSEDINICQFLTEVLYLVANDIKHFYQLNWALCSEVQNLTLLIEVFSDNELTDDIKNFIETYQRMSSIPIVDKKTFHKYEIQSLLRIYYKYLEMD